MLHRWSLLIVIVAIGVMVGVLDGCTRLGLSQKPSWIDGTSEQYPASQYLLGVGQADSRAASTERAYAAVARIFKAEISAQARDWESYLVLENRGKASTERRLTLDHVTNVSTDKVLENVQILDSWFDRRTGQHYVMAGMNRAQSEAALVERIAELDRTVETEIRESRESQDKLTRVRNMKRAAKNLVLREAYNADLRVIRTSGQGVAPVYRVADLTNELEQFLATNLIIGVQVTGEQTEPTRRAVMEGLIREGLPVTGRQVGVQTGPGGEDGGLAPELLVKGTVRLWNVDVGDPQFKYVRWCSDFVIVEIATQRIVGAVSKGGREGHLSEREAMAKAVRIMQQELSSDLAKTLAGYIYGETDQPLGTVPPAACPREEGQTGHRPSGTGPL